MKFIRTKKYPLKGFNAITHYPFIFYKHIMSNTIMHEAIHINQQAEILVASLIILFAIFGFSFWLIASYFVFYVLYLFEYLVRFAYYKDAKKAYTMISFEQEAYKNEESENYLEKRTIFSFIKYLFKWQ